jgi:hypothetical protein
VINERQRVRYPRCERYDLPLFEGTCCKQAPDLPNERQVGRFAARTLLVILNKLTLNIFPSNHLVF